MKAFRAAPLLLLWFAPFVGAQPAASADGFDLALAASRERAGRAFLSQQPGQPFIDDAASLPPVPGDAAEAARREGLASALRDARAVQEGCALPCTTDTDVELYMAKVKLAAAGLKLPADAVAAAVEHYAPKRVARKRAARGAPAPNTLDERAVEALLSRRDLPPASRRAFTARASSIAQALDQRRIAETVPGGGAVAAGGSLTAAERARLLDAYRSAPAGDSAALQTLKIAEPPSPPAARRAPEPAPGLTSVQKAALWFADKVGSKNIQAASDFSAGFGDSMTFGATHWVRGKMGTNSQVNDGGTAYSGGSLAAVALSLMLAGGGILKPLTGGVQQVARWAPTIAEDGGAVLKEGQFVMAGQSRGLAGAWNWLKAGGPELAWKAGPRYFTSATAEVPGGLLRYPIAEEGRVAGFVKGLMGQRVYVGPTAVLH